MNNESINLKFTNRDHGFAVVVERLKKALGLKTDLELAKALDMSPSNFANKKRQQSIPYEAVIDLCTAKAISLDWLFSGAGETFTNQEQREIEAIPATIDPKLLTTVLYELEVAFADDAKNAKVRAEQIVRLGLVAVGLYNKFVFVKNEKVRRSAIRNEAREYASIEKLLNEEITFGEQ